MRILTKLAPIGQGWRRFRADTAGSGTVEAVIILPMLFWWFITSFQFFEAFKERNVNIKAAYTITDMITRETVPVDAVYIKGMDAAFEYLTISDEKTWIRVSSLVMDVNLKKLQVQWSQATDSKPKLKNEDLIELGKQVPIMTDGDTVIVVETHSSFQPIFDIGLNNLWFDQFVVMRPRFLPKISYTGGDVTG